MKAAKGKEAAKYSREALKPVDDRLVEFCVYFVYNFMHLDWNVRF